MGFVVSLIFETIVDARAFPSQQTALEELEWGRDLPPDGARDISILAKEGLGDGSDSSALEDWVIGEGGKLGSIVRCLGKI